MKRLRLWRNLSAASLMAIAATVSGLAGSTPAAQAANPVPLPSALSNHPFAKQFSASELAGAREAERQGKPVEGNRGQIKEEGGN